MAHQSNLAEWLLQKKDSLDFRVTHYTWTDDFAKGYSDFAVSFNDGIVGRATDQIVETALNKAIAEAVERATCVANNLITSAGVAAHPDRAKAFQYASHEITERIAFDIHFSGRLPFQKIDPIAPESKESVLTFRELGIDFNFYRLMSPEGLNVVCAAAFGERFERPFGVIFGFGCSDDRQCAERSALFESLRNVACHIKDEETTSLSIEDFKKIENPIFFDRFRLALDLNYRAEIDFLFGAPTEVLENFPPITVQPEELPKPDLFEDAPVVVMKARPEYKFLSKLCNLPAPLD